MKLGALLVCKMIGHNWTAKVHQNLDADGKPVVPNHLRPKEGDSVEEIMRKFRDYSRMYCKRCGTVSKLTL
jgi:hypothetical protein